jgi:hypothetical protein
MMKKKTLLSVSAISNYADDPERFCRTGGKAFNPKTAELGTEAHDRAGKSNLPTYAFIGFVCFVCIFLGALWKIGLIG